MLESLRLQRALGDDDEREEQAKRMRLQEREDKMIDLKYRE